MVAGLSNEHAVVCIVRAPGGQPVAGGTSENWANKTSCRRRFTAGSGERGPALGDGGLRLGHSSHPAFPMVQLSSGLQCCQGEEDFDHKFSGAFGTA